MSHESEFLIISDPSWTEIPGITEIIHASPAGEVGVNDFLAQNLYAGLEPMFEDAGIMPPRKTLTNVRLIKVGDGEFRMWVQYGDIPPDPVV